MTLRDFIELRPENSAFKSLAQSYLEVMDAPDSLDTPCPATVKKQEIELRNEHRLIKFEPERSFIPREEYSDSLLIREDAYGEGTTWKLRWINLAQIDTVIEAVFDPKL